MEWFLIAIAVVLLIHVLIAAFLWRGFRSGNGDTDQSMAVGVLIRFVIVPLALVVIILLTVLWVPEPEDTVGWIIVVALLAYMVYLSLSAIYFGLRLVRDQRR
jgi:hypothetical protein